MPSTFLTRFGPRHKCQGTTLPVPVKPDFGLLGWLVCLARDGVANRGLRSRAVKLDSEGASLRRRPGVEARAQRSGAPITKFMNDSRWD
jgi:hypothetical protein